MVRTMARGVIIALLIVVGVCPLTAGEPEVVALWPETAQTTSAVEEVQPARGDNVKRITKVTHPTLTVYRIKETTQPAPAVIVCPGGGYKILAINIEGTDIAEWLNSIGITAFVLKYHVPDARDAALADAQRALRLIRARATEWNIDPNRVGMVGFSAGGHLTARTSNSYGKPAYAPADDADKQSCRPDFAILVYPAYLANSDYEPASDIEVTTGTPATFIVQTQDDKKFIPSALVYSAQLTRAGVECEFHMFPQGGHGFGLRRKEHAVSSWPRLCEDWLRRRRIVTNHN